jgi:hypothetical protein
MLIKTQLRRSANDYCYLQHSETLGPAQLQHMLRCGAVVFVRLALLLRIQFLGRGA